MSPEIIFRDEIRIWGSGGEISVRAMRFSIVSLDGEYQLAVHPTLGNSETLTITECQSGLAITQDLDIRLLDFPEILIPRCRDYMFELRCKIRDLNLLDIIERECIRIAQAMELIEDDIPF